MSSLPITDPYITYNDSLDELWSLYQEILSENDHQLVIKENPLNHEATKIGSSSDFGIEQQHLATTTEEGLIILENNINEAKSTKNSTRNSKKRKRNCSRNNTDYNYNINVENGGNISGQSEEGPLISSVAKKLDHNAKERIRRMKVNASFLALRELLPDHHSRKSKKRLNLRAPAIVDRALKYIPELENEIELLISKKENVKSKLKKKNKKINNGTNGRNSSQQQSCTTISVNKVCEEEAIVQICVGKENDEHQEGSSTLSNLLQRVEDKGVCIISASTIYVCETRSCYHLHIQMNQISYGVCVDFIAELQEKILPWLR